MVPKFTRLKKKDKLANLVDTILDCESERDFFFILSQKLRGGTGKPYHNRDHLLPEGGRYEEFEVTNSQDPRRIVVEMDSRTVYATRDHYRTMLEAGKVNF